MKIRQENYGDLIHEGIKSGDADRLQQISRALHRLDELACNVGYDEGGPEDRRKDRLEEEGKKLAEKYDLLFYHQGDPRGWSVYLVKPERLGGYNIDAVYDRGTAVCPH